MAFTLREATASDAGELIALERVCFPENEAEKAENIIRRLSDVPGCFLAAADESGVIAGFICGVPTNETRFRDEFFTNTSLYSPDGKTVMLLSLEVGPSYRGMGLARQLMDAFVSKAEASRRERLVLTCHDGLIPLYESMGFKLLGVADSSWGGGSWNEMERELCFTLPKARYRAEDRFMQLAVDEAREGIYKGHGGPFGCVIVRDGRVIGRGHNRVLSDLDSTCHGEIAAIRDAERRLRTYDLKGSVLYTTGEPCMMCLTACLWANISLIRYGCTIEDNSLIGFRDGELDGIFGGRGKLKAYLEETDRAACLELFSEYAGMDGTVY